MSAYLNIAFGESVGLIAATIVLVYLWYMRDAAAYSVSILSLLTVNIFTFDAVFINWGLSSAGGTYLFPVAVTALAMCTSRCGQAAAIRVWKMVALGLAVFLTSQMRWLWYIFTYGNNETTIAQGHMVRNAVLLLVAFWVSGAALMIMRKVFVRYEVTRWVRSFVSVWIANVVTLPLSFWSISVSHPNMTMLWPVIGHTVIIRTAVIAYCCALVMLLVAVTNKAVSPPRRGAYGIN